MSDEARAAVCGCGMKKRMVVFVGSPYGHSSDEELRRNLAYARALCRGVALEGHVPIAPHLYVPTFLADGDSDEREIGLKIAKEVLKRCDVAMFGVDLGTSSGMKGEMALCEKEGILYGFSRAEHWIGDLGEIEAKWRAQDDAGRESRIYTK